MRDKLGRFTKGRRHKLSKEIRDKIGLANSIALRGRKQSKEHIQNAIDGKKGYKHTEETRKKMSLAKIGKKGKPPSEETRRKIGEAHLGKRNFNWKGENVSYRGLHYWVVRQKGKPKICKHCGTTNKEKRLHWANIDHKYRRNLDDFISLCALCHKRHDKQKFIL